MGGSSPREMKMARAYAVGAYDHTPRPIINNGTLVNGQRLFQPQKLLSGDQLQLGNLKFSFNQEQEATVPCSNCKRGIRPGVKFCRFCGTAQSGVLSPQIAF